MTNDLMQDTFEKLWLNRKKVSVDKSRQWLFTTGYRLMLNGIKRENKIDYEEDLSSHGLKDIPHNLEEKDLIAYLLSYLTEQQKAIVLLRDYEGYDYKEIGEILSLSESQVKVYLFRARQKLKEQIKIYSDFVA